jgi:ABC-type transport system involved in cytochrome c biogenesis permease component
MHFAIASFRKDIARWRQERSSFLIWLAIPLMIGGLLTLMSSGGDNGGPSGTLLIDDQDDTLISGFVAGAFTQEQMGDLFVVQQVSAKEGAALMEAGEASGFLTIPSGFQDAFLNDTPITLPLKTNPSQVILPGIIENVTEVLLDAGFYLQAMFGSELRKIQGNDAVDGPSNIFVSEVAVEINEKMQTLGESLTPLAFDLDIVEPPAAEPQPDIGLLFLPGIVLMALLFTSQGVSSDYWKERENGTLRRLVSSPGLLNQFVFGKAIAAAVIIGIIAGITMLLGFLYHDVAWSKLLPSMLFVVSAGVGFFAWFAALQMLFSSRKGASLLTTILLFPLMMMGGSFFPLDALPNWLAEIGRMSPNGFVADRFTTELTSATAWTYDLKSWAIILAMTISGLAISSWRLKTGFARR